MSNLDSTRLREVLDYCPQTGVFTWRLNRQNVKAGNVAGTITPRGYCRISVLGRGYAAHRLAWLWVHGVWPSGQIDHINGQRADNRLPNLRDVSAATDSQNQRHPQGDNPFLGVSLVRNKNRWIARMRLDGEQRYIGCYATPEEARAAYLAAKRVHHHGCTI